MSRTSDEAKSESLIPLEVAVCDSCQHAFLPYLVAPSASYAEYAFTSQSSPGLKAIMGDLARTTWMAASACNGDYVLDIGSNDGTLLEAFQSLGGVPLAIEPSKKHADFTSQQGILTVNDYFSASVAASLKSDGFKPRIVAAHNVLANAPDPQDFLGGISNLCSDGSLVSIVTGYHLDQFAASMFDYVYHEHLSYFSLHDLHFLAQSVDLEIIYARRIALKGGSLHVLLRPRPSVIQPKPEVENLLAWERWVGVNEQSMWSSLRRRIDENKNILHRWLEQVEGECAWGYGFSHSVTTLTYEMEITEKLLGFVDDNESRHGLYSPGSGLEIFSPEVLRETKQPVVVLAWQHDWRIQQQLQLLGHRGPVMRPMPNAEVVVGGR